VPIAVEVRTLSATTALAIDGLIDRVDLGAWCAGALDELRRVASRERLELVGPAGGRFDQELFTDERGEAMLFLPVAGARSTSGRARVVPVPGGSYAVATHEGAHQDADRTYGALGSYVAERGLGADGPVREHYLVGATETSDVTAWRTEIGWPIQA
jgi:effector-binding domain-containing protein